MGEHFSNFADTTLVTTVSSSDLSIVLADGSFFPSTNFYIVLDAENAAREIVYVTSRSGNTLTVASTADRGVKGTTAVGHTAGASIIHAPLAHHFTDIYAIITPVTTGSTTFSYTGANQSFTVPDGITVVTVVASGAEGGTSDAGTDAHGGKGGVITSKITVTPGETLTVVVGQKGQNTSGSSFNGGGAVGGTGGQNGGGGGGATDIRRGSTRLVIAGGGGGGGGNAVSAFGGDGGTDTGDTGINGTTGVGGTGGTQSVGGTAGGGNATNGSQFTGGDGSSTNSRGGGGGGAGYYGGGGGGHGNGAGQGGSGGGGGSSYSSGSILSNLKGGRSGDGTLTVSWGIVQTFQKTVDDTFLWTDPIGFDYEFDATTTSLPSGWSWANQGSSTYSEQYGAGLIVPQVGSGENWRMIVQSLSGLPTSWTATSKIIGVTQGSNAYTGGIILRESSSGKLVTFSAFNSLLVYVEKWTNATTYAGSAFNGGSTTLARPQYYKIIKTSSTVWDFQASPDGIAWVTLTGSVNVGAFMTPDQIGFGISGTASTPAQVACHWLRVR